MKYKVSFIVMDTYPTVEIEAKDRDEAVKLYQDLWKQGKFTQGILKDAKWNITSIWTASKPKAS